MAASSRPPDYGELLEIVRAWVDANCPGHPLEHLVLQLHRLPLPIQLVYMAAMSGNALPPRPGSDGEGHEPSEYQCRILEALEYRALRTEALIDVLGGDRRRLWKPGGITELKEWGWVKLDRVKKLGYYRPDAPPSELEGVEQPPDPK